MHLKSTIACALVAALSLIVPAASRPSVHAAAQAPAICRQGDIVHTVAPGTYSIEPRPGFNAVDATPAELRCYGLPSDPSELRNLHHYITPVIDQNATARNKQFGLVGSSTSTTWAGYAAKSADNSNKTYWQVHGHWTVPTVPTLPITTLLTTNFDGQTAGALSTGVPPYKFNSVTGATNLTVQNTESSSVPNAISVNVAGGGASYAEADLSGFYQQFQLTFRVKLGTDFHLGTGKYMTLAQLLPQAGSNVGKLNVILPDTGALRFDYFDSSGVQHYVYNNGYTLTTGGWHTIDVNETFGTTTGAVTLKVDGTAIASASSINLSTWGLNIVKVGEQYSPADVTTTGHLYVDDVLGQSTHGSSRDVAAWIGLGGITSNIIWQAGSDSTTGAVPNYRLWYENYCPSGTANCINNGAAVFLSSPVPTPGWNWYVDLASNVTGATPTIIFGDGFGYTTLTFTTMASTGTDSSGEWIVEEPGGTPCGDACTYTSFKTTTFTNSSVQDSNNVWTTLDTVGYRRYDMTQAAITVQPSVVSGTGINNSFNLSSAVNGTCC